MADMYFSFTNWSVGNGIVSGELIKIYRGVKRAPGR